MKYWKNGFYLEHQENSVEITDDYWKELLEGQSNGKQIASNEEGYPILIERPAPTEEELNTTEIATLKAYLTSTDYIYPKCLELDLDVDVVYADIVAQRKLARTSIQELEASI